MFCELDPDQMAHVMYQSHKTSRLWFSGYISAWTHITSPQMDGLCMGHRRRVATTDLIVAFYLYVSCSSMCHCVKPKKNKKLATST